MTDVATTLMSSELMSGRGLTAPAGDSGLSRCPGVVRLLSNSSTDADVTTTGATAATWPTYALTAKHRAETKPGFITVIHPRLTRRPLERFP
jgi:hypothetical protein